jgi:hypothetical protein
MTPEKKSTTCLAMDGRPELKELLQQASQALALLDCARLEELATACEAFNRDVPKVSRSEARVAAQGMDALGKVLEVTRANLKIMDRIRGLHNPRIEYSEHQARGSAAESAYGHD